MIGFSERVKKNISLILIVLLAVVFCESIDLSCESFSSGGGIKGSSNISVSHSWVAFTSGSVREDNGRSLTCSYIIICAAAAYIGNVGNPLKVAVTAILAGTILILLAARKKHLLEFVKGIPLALISVLCAWAFLTFGL